MAWLILVIAGLMEMAWAIFLKQSHGLTRVGPAIGFFVTLLISMFLLAQSLRTQGGGEVHRHAAQRLNAPEFLGDVVDRKKHRRATHPCALPAAGAGSGRPARK